MINVGKALTVNPNPTGLSEKEHFQRIPVFYFEQENLLKLCSKFTSL
jgi:hypothetical protein